MSQLQAPESYDHTVTRYRKLAAELPAGEPDFRRSWQQLASLGIFETRLPAQPTGSNPQATAIRQAVAAIEGIGAAGIDPGLCYAATSQLFGIQLPLQAVLTGPQAALLDGVAEGRTLLCHASTETTGGSDPLSGELRAVASADGGYLLQGRKSYVTAAPVADLGLVFARTAEGRSPFALSAFLVDLEHPSIRREPAVSKTALPGAPMGALSFDQTPVGADRLVGDEGAGLAVMSSTTTWERALLLSYALGPMSLLLERTVQWCRSRRHFDRPMGSSHLVAGRVADMALRLRRSRTMLLSMAAEFDAGRSPASMATGAALTKISVSEDYAQLTRDATMLAGVRAFVEDSGLTAVLADPLAAMTYAGPNDLLRIAVARDHGLPVIN